MGWWLLWMTQEARCKWKCPGRKGEYPRSQGILTGSWQGPERKQMIGFRMSGRDVEQGLGFWSLDRTSVGEAWSNNLGPGQSRKDGKIWSTRAWSDQDHNQDRIRIKTMGLELLLFILPDQRQDCPRAWDRAKPKGGFYVTPNNRRGNMLESRMPCFI